MRDIYTRLYSQNFPNLGGTLEITANKLQLKQENTIWSSFYYKKFSQQNQIYNPTQVKRIRRPIDFRMEGSAICKFLELPQLLLLYATVLTERRVVVISSSLR